MSHRMPSMKNTNWWYWGGGTFALLVALIMLFFGMDFFGWNLSESIPASSIPTE